MNKSPLRYPGGKSRACKTLDKFLIDHEINMDSYDSIYSPFFGGGSFEFFIQNKYNVKIVGNDKFKPLYYFWKSCKDDKEKLCKKLETFINKITKEIFVEIRKTIMDKSFFESAYNYFIINRCSFSGATLSGGFSDESSKKRFTKSSIDRINKMDLTNFEIHNLDFEEFINNNKGKNGLFFLDPPYYLESKSKLYGNNGDLHEHFDHVRLFKILKSLSKENQWIMTYNNCEYIKNLYKDYEIVETSWSYGMNKSKKSSEIIIKPF